MLRTTISSETGELMFLLATLNACLSNPQAHFDLAGKVPRIEGALAVGRTHEAWQLMSEGDIDQAKNTAPNAFAVFVNNEIQEEITW